MWHKEKKPNFWQGSIGFILVMVFNPVYKGTISRIWNAYNGSNVYLPITVRISICVDAFIFISFVILHIFELIVSAIILIPWTIVLLLYIVYMDKIETTNIWKYIVRIGWFAKECAFLCKMLCSWFIFMTSIHVYTIVVVPLLSGQLNWGDSFVYAMSGEYCEGKTVETNNWAASILLIAWILF